MAPEPGGLDIIGLAVLLVFLGTPTVLLLIAYLKYRGLWNRRVQELWGTGALARAHSSLPNVSRNSGNSKRDAQAVYLRDLAGIEPWTAELAPATEGNTSPESVPPEKLAENILAVCERDIARRAIATGLTVGISPSRLFDHITIVLASLEIQMHVLASLGRRPSLRTWYQCLVRAGTSLFANSYMNREDAFMLQYTTKGIATGLSAAGDMIDDLEFDEHRGDGTAADGTAGGENR